MVRNFRCGEDLHVQLFEFNRIIDDALQFLSSTLEIGLFSCISKEVVLLEIVVIFATIGIPTALLSQQNLQVCLLLFS